MGGGGSGNFGGTGGAGGAGGSALPGAAPVPAPRAGLDGADRGPAPPAAPPSAAPAGTPPLDARPSSEKPGDGDFVEITSYYVTNRKPTGSVVPAEFYGTDDGQMQYGRMVVTIPASHTAGNIELPSLWKLEVNPDPSKHFVIKALSPLDSGAALGEIRQAVSKAGSRSLLLFVHGFNVTFAEAGLRTAQLAHDLVFQGVPMFMSWPASRLYTHDVEAVQVAQGSLDKLLDDISNLPFDDVYILAHSMGTRLVTAVLADRAQRGADVSKIRDLMLAAPDINAQIFETQIAPALSRMTKARKTIYASSNDLALRASVAIQGYRRVGETNGGVLTFPGFDTIDCSNIAPLQRSWGHSYLFDSSLVLADLVDTLIGGKAAAQRKLMRTGVAPSLYWLLQ
jgi:esterase/lipase superfamily enzyme